MTTRGELKGAARDPLDVWIGDAVVGRFVMISGILAGVLAVLGLIRLVDKVNLGLLFCVFRCACIGLFSWMRLVDAFRFHSWWCIVLGVGGLDCSELVLFRACFVC